MNTNNLYAINQCTQYTGYVGNRIGAKVNMHNNNPVTPQEGGREGGRDGREEGREEGRKEGGEKGGRGGGR